jgi:hypothetical protein
MGPAALLPSEEVMLQISIAFKNPLSSARSEPMNLGSSAKHNNHCTTKNDCDTQTMLLCFILYTVLSLFISEHILDTSNVVDKKDYEVYVNNEVPLNGITSLPNIMKIYHAVQKLLVGDTETDRLVI